MSAQPSPSPRLLGHPWPAFSVTWDLREGGLTSDLQKIQTEWPVSCREAPLNRPLTQMLWDWGIFQNLLSKSSSPRWPQVPETSAPGNKCPGAQGTRLTAHSGARRSHSQSGDLLPRAFHWMPCPPDLLPKMKDGRGNWQVFSNEQHNQNLHNQNTTALEVRAPRGPSR